MELQWGGGAGGSGVFSKIAGVVCRARSVGAASNNKPTRGRLAEGYWLHISPSEAVSLQARTTGYLLGFPALLCIGLNSGQYQGPRM